MKVCLLLLMETSLISMGIKRASVDCTGSVEMCELSAEIETQVQRSHSVTWLSSTRGTWDSILCTFLETTQFDLYQACKFSISHNTMDINTCCAHLHTFLHSKCCSAAEAVSFSLERKKHAAADIAGIRSWLCQEKLDAVKHILLMCLQGLRRVGAAPECAAG